MFAMSGISGALVFFGPLYIAGMMVSPLHWIGALIAACLTNSQNHPWKKAILFSGAYAAFLASTSMWNSSNDRWGQNYVFLIVVMLIALFLQGLVMKLIVSFFLAWDKRVSQTVENEKNAKNQ
jgi:uncharacterized membrane protein YjdF